MNFEFPPWCSIPQNTGKYIHTIQYIKGPNLTTLLRLFKFSHTILLNFVNAVEEINVYQIQTLITTEK